MLVGSVLFHLLRALKRSFVHIISWFAITGLIAAVVVEIAAIVGTHGSFPTLLTHLTALALGLAIGYAVAISMLVTEVFRDLIEAFETMTHDLTKELGMGSKLIGAAVQSFEHRI